MTFTPKTFKLGCLNGISIIPRPLQSPKEERKCVHYKAYLMLQHILEGSYFSLGLQQNHRYNQMSLRLLCRASALHLVKQTEVFLVRVESWCKVKGRHSGINKCIMKTLEMSFYFFFFNVRTPALN